MHTGSNCSFSSIALIPVQKGMCTGRFSGRNHLFLRSQILLVFGWLFLFFKCTKYTLEIRVNNKLKLMSLILLYVYNMIRKLQCYHLCWVVFIDHDQISISYLTEKSKCLLWILQKSIQTR